MTETEQQLDRIAAALGDGATWVRIDSSIEPVLGVPGVRFSRPAPTDEYPDQTVEFVVMPWYAIVPGAEPGVVKWIGDRLDRMAANPEAHRPGPLVTVDDD